MTDMDSTAFWSTGAQTMPVIALAIVVEARAILNKWKFKDSPILKSVMGILWMLPLFMMLFAEGKAFDALSGEEVSSFWKTWVSVGVGLGMTSLCVNPLIEILVRSNSLFVARANFRTIRFMGTARNFLWRNEFPLSKRRKRREIGRLDLEMENLQDAIERRKSELESKPKNKENRMHLKEVKGSLMLLSKYKVSLEALKVDLDNPEFFETPQLPEEILSRQIDELETLLSDFEPYTPLSP